ncbi:hypothetical protein E2562_015229 [Oryza meyeriana var. granulata]|uniref:Uncharacterized protein n=1 Tax=Oryza meyeriana var. granulata TaxID=110450 RepID=A0A6G1EWZ7_9ORYZ|nr:hypothetical protein E2562_015229 [Oryza meyeriana var. granulata]
MTCPRHEDTRTRGVKFREQRKQTLNRHCKRELTTLYLKNTEELLILAANTKTMEEIVLRSEINAITCNRTFILHANALPGKLATMIRSPCLPASVLAPAEDQLLPELFIHQQSILRIKSNNTYVTDQRRDQKKTKQSKLMALF